MPIFADLDLPALPVPHMLRIVETVDTPSNLIERSLSECEKRIETGEAACVRKSLADDKLSVSKLIAMLPGCRQGRICEYKYTTDDKVGLVPSVSDHFKVSWKVEFDFTKSAKTSDAVPITVTQG